MDSQMKLLLDKMKEEFQIQTKNISENVTKTLVAAMDEKIKPLVEQNQLLKKEVHQLKLQVKGLQQETKRNNFLIHGIPEKESSNKDLMDLILTTLNIVSKNAGTDNWDKWEISKIYRIGKKVENKNRPILITPTLAWRKLEILKNNKMFPENVYATEDFPKEVLNKRKELQVRLKEEISKGKIAYIRYDKLIVKEKANEKRKRAPSNSPNGPSNDSDINSVKKIIKTNPRFFRSNSENQPTTSLQNDKSDQQQISNRKKQYQTT